MTAQERLTAVAAMNEHLEVLKEIGLDVSVAEAWPTFTGLPSSSIYDIFQWAMAKQIQPPELLMTVAAIAFAHGRKQATSEAKTASEGI